VTCRRWTAPRASRRTCASAHLSPRACVAAAREVAAREPRLAAGASKWLDELVWREFYAAILEEHPRVLRHSFRPEFERVRWNHDGEAWARWCEGRTGYPIVDAGMRQLAQTGWMHNRARMISASFLVKDLLLDWRLGERWFLAKLVDGDPASNNGGWQWSASTGTDAQPYFRIFSPVAQGERFDPEGAYVRRFVPELRDVPTETIHQPWRARLLCPDYPPPIVDHGERRRIAIVRFEEARVPPLWRDDAIRDISSCLLGEEVRWDGEPQARPLLDRRARALRRVGGRLPGGRDRHGHAARGRAARARARRAAHARHALASRLDPPHAGVRHAPRARARASRPVRLRAQEGLAELWHGARQGARCEGLRAGEA
jgi:hypothetical protein